jgi:hypothetical protein
MFFPWFVLGIIDKFIIMTVRDANQKPPKNNPYLFSFFIGVWKIIHVKKR